MPLPSITIDESDVGIRPVNVAPLNKIGLVGMFNWGPPDSPTLVHSLAELLEQFGPTYETGLTGQLSGYGIYAQNPRADVYVVRVTPTSVAPVKATKNFVVTATVTLRIDALYPGTEGNNISVQVSAGTLSNTFKLTVIDSNLGITEVWDNLDIRTTTSNLASAGGPNEPGAGSALIAAVKIANNAANPDNVAAALLSTGTPGTNGTAQASDYVGAVAGGGGRTGFYALDPITDVRYILAAQQTSGTVWTGLETYIEGRGVADGLVIGLFTQPAATAPGSVDISTLDTKRGFMIYPFWKSSIEPLAARDTFIAIDGHVAGVLSKLKPHESPSNKQVLGLTTPQYAVIDSQGDDLVDALVNPITVVRNRGIRIRSGVTLSSDIAWSQLAIRNEYDKIEMEAWEALAWAVSEPNDADLRQRVADQLDALLRQELGQGAIAGFQPTVCDETNNTPQDIAAGRLKAQMRVQFAYPADFITIGIDRVLTS